jgi:histidinol phosphatase-like PHP family hydrolase
VSNVLYDFHTHTTMSDGDLCPIELLRRAVVNGYAAIALTDHAGLADAEHMLKTVIAACETAQQYWGITALPGLELTHLPPAAIADAARWARAHGSQIIVVHGETITEPVLPGTNHAAVVCPGVDVLAHPGFLTDEDAQIAAANGIFVELSGRRGNAFTNGHVANVGRKANVRFLVNSDAHDPEDMLTADFAHDVARGAGLSDEETITTLTKNPLLLLERIRQRRQKGV